MKNWMWIIIALIVVALMVLPQFLFKVDVTKQAIVLQFGKHVRTIHSPGLYVKTPFVQEVRYYEKRILVSDAAAGEYFTSERKRLVVDHVTRWRITDPLKFFKTVIDETGGRNRLQAIVFSEMREELARDTLSEVISERREPIVDAVTIRAREKLREFGIEVVDVRIKSVDVK